MFFASKNQQQGFTLLGLLVVLAILGILASTIVSNLKSARRHARDAALQQTMGQLYRESFVDAGFSSGAVDPCNPPVGSQTETLVDEIQKFGDGDMDCKRHQVSNTVYQWRISIAGNTLDTESGDRFCVDSAGFVGIIDVGQDGNMPASQRLCTKGKPGGGNN